jgi:hypothetical protein
VVLIILVRLYPQSVIIGTLLEFVFFGTCGAVLVYFLLSWYEGDRLPRKELYGDEDYSDSPEWDRVKRFSIGAGVVIGIIAVVIVGPVTGEQASESFDRWLSPR